MQTKTIQITSYVADEGFYFYNAENKVIATQLFLGKNDTIENYTEITEEEKIAIEAEWEAEAEKDREELEREIQ